MTKIHEYATLKLVPSNREKYPIHVLFDGGTTNKKNTIYIANDVDFLFFLSNAVLFDNYYTPTANPYGEPLKLVYIP